VDWTPLQMRATRGRISRESDSMPGLILAWLKLEVVQVALTRVTAISSSRVPRVLLVTRSVGERKRLACPTATLSP